MVDFSELLAETEKFEETPALVLCRLKNGKECILTDEECIRLEAKYIRSVCGEPDELIAHGLE